MAMIKCKSCGHSISKQAATCPQCGHPNKQPTSQGSGCLVLIVLAAGIWAITQYGGGGSLPTSNAPPDPKPAALSKVEIKNVTWEKGGFGSVMLLTATIHNGGNQAFKDFTIRCTHYSSSKTRIGQSSEKVFEVVPANGSKRLTKFNMGLVHSQAVSTGCKVTDLTLI